MEVEVKYALPAEDSFAAGSDEEIINHSSEWRTRRMSSIYYENDLDEMRAKHYALRFRMEGDEPVCCVKYGGGSGDGGVKMREEKEFVAENIESGVKTLLGMDIPEDFKAAIRRPLKIAAEIDFERRSAMLTFDDFTCELAMDEGLFCKIVPFREIEFELKSGDCDSMMNFCQKIAGKYGLVPEHRSKLERALQVVTK